MHVRFTALPGRQWLSSTVLVQDSEFYDARVKLAHLQEASIRVQDKMWGARSAVDIFDAVVSNPLIEKRMVPSGTFEEGRGGGDDEYRFHF